MCVILVLVMCVVIKIVPLMYGIYYRIIFFDREHRVHKVSE